MLALLTDPLTSGLAESVRSVAISVRSVVVYFFSMDSLREGPCLLC